MLNVKPPVGLVVPLKTVDSPKKLSFVAVSKKGKLLSGFVVPEVFTKSKESSNVRVTPVVLPRLFIKLKVSPDWLPVETVILFQFPVEGNPVFWDPKSRNVLSCP